jgi:4-hydroxy-3-polyprenylbenzoate decarboxylase
MNAAMATNDPLRLVLGVTGASGAIYARALLRTLCASPRVRELHVVMSDAARRVAADELSTTGTAVEVVKQWLGDGERRAEIVVHPVRDIGASIAFGSFAHDGMVVVPCTTGSAAAIATGVSSHLVHRAAECCLKERRKLIVMLRETPLSLVHLRNLVALAEAGAVVMPLSPPLYHRPATIDDLVDDTIARALDHLGLPEAVKRRWDGEGGAAR